MDLVVVLLLSLITIPVVALTDGLARIVLGVIVLLIAPGYSLTAALFPQRATVKCIERAGLSLVLSFAIVSLSGLALNFTPWGIRLTPIMIAIESLIVLLLGIAFYRRSLLPETERFAVHLKMGRWRFGQLDKIDRVLYAALFVVVIGALSTLGYVIAQPKNQESFTDFYMLGPEGKMENYPRQVSLNGQATVTLAIENHERQAESYTVQVIFAGEQTGTIGPLNLENEQKWTDEVKLTPSQEGPGQPVELLLYKGSSPTAYLTLRLWLDVTN